MMIRINLLPVRQVKKREAGRQFLFAMAGVALFAVIANAWWFFAMEGEQTKREGRLADTNARIQQLEKVIGEVNNIKKREEEVKKKLETLEVLRKQRGGPVKLLDALSTAIPKKVWMTDFDEKSGAVKLLGHAESYDDVSDFMKGLNTIVWTPKGMGRIVEKKRDGTSARVELLSGAGIIEDFAGPDVAYFFSNIELKSSEANALQAKSLLKTVKFELSLNVNYAI
jgi:type IV pilus assembly protein PilN